MGESDITVIDNQKNRDLLPFLGFLPYQRLEIIRNLKPKNYCQGPMEDQDGSEGEIWTFGYKESGITVYIKLKLDDEAKCLSFHRAEYKMEFPFDK
jgi:hypothetical protein